MPARATLRPVLRGETENAFSYEEIQSYTFAACWNDLCWTGRHFASVPTDTYPLLVKPPNGFFPSSAPSFFFDLGRDESTAVFELRSTWMTRYSGAYTNGDVLRSSVRNERGFLVEHQAVVDYTLENPNPGCGMSGGCCRPVAR